MNNYGMKVTIKIAWMDNETVLRNVTEIHHRYRTTMPGHDRTAFESDIHSTGVTYDNSDIEEFIAVPETEKAPSF